jgi:glycosyltransferase involved in cell wall biosynthesis
LIRGRNIVCLASNWFEHPTSKHHVMRILAEHNHVLWVNYHASRRPKLGGRDARIIARRLRQVCGGARRVSPTLDVLSPLLVPMPDSWLARHVNGRVLARQIRAALRRTGRPQSPQVAARPTQLWLFTPDVPELIGLLPAERVVYYCVDDFGAFAGFDPALVAELERRTIAASDVVVASSTKLYEQCRPQHGNTHLVLHGVDYEHFAAAADLSPDAIPDDIKHLPRPVLGYFGLISDYVDLELLAQAARHRPDWSFVLIGEARCDLGCLRGLSNVHVLGGRAYEELPAYCRGFDVGLVPFRMNRLTRAVNPIKLREYLAAGLPVVSAPLPEVNRYAHRQAGGPSDLSGGSCQAVYLAAGLDEFLVACAAALRAGSATDRHTRQTLVQSEGWRARVELLSEIVSSSRCRRRACGRQELECPVTVG